jgi:hypothetical protein
MSPVVFLLDVDNTLLDNDAVQVDLKNHLEEQLGAAGRDRYWAILEELRGSLGYVDYLGALQRYREKNECEPGLLKMSSFLIDYPFADRLFPRALEVIRHLRQWGPAVIFSDGDVVFQPHKVERSGLRDAVDDEVLIFIHKEQNLADVEKRYPAKHYVMVDDKVRILAAIKKAWGNRVTTIFPRQGHYAHDPKELAKYPPADVTVERIGDLLELDRPRLLKNAGK